MIRQRPSASRLPIICISMSLGTVALSFHPACASAIHGLPAAASLWIAGHKDNITGRVAIGDPKNPAALAQDLQNAYNAGARNIVIKPGIYLMPSVGHTAITLDDWKDATISAYKVTIIIQDLKWTHDVFDLNRCENVTLAGPVLSQTQITSYQGKVVAVGKDAAGKALVDWNPDAGYPIPGADMKKFPGAANVIDGRTRLLKVGNPDFYDVPIEPIGNGVFRFHFDRGALNFGVGDWLVGRYGDAPFKVSLSESRNCTLKDITMMRNGFAPLREDMGGGNHIIHCRWALGPKPAGATEEPLITNAADGVHSTGANPGPDFEDCRFEGVFLDDCIAIHGSFQNVKAVNGKELTVENGWARLAVGEPVRISSDKGFFAEGKVTALKDNGDKTSTVTLDQDLSVPVGSKLSNPMHNGAGYKIVGCHLGNTRSRGILIKSDNGLIKNNVIEGCGMPAISIGPEYWWGEADYVLNATIEGNTIRENGKMGGDAAILVHGDGAQGNRNIVIKNNTMVSNYGGDIHIDWTNGATITGNTLTGPPSWPAGTTPRQPITVANSTAVTTEPNTITDPKRYAAK